MKIRISIIAIVSIAAFTAILLVKYKAEAVPVLLYHSIEEKPGSTDKYSISLDDFKRQMRFLKENGFRVITLKELVSTKKRKIPVPGRAVALTFDDGFENHYTNVLPVLRQYGFYATMFVITDRIGHRGYLSWDQVRKIEESGVAEIGSHSRSSRNLAGEVSDRVLNEEISGSKSILDSNLKNPTEFFAYPFGGYNNKVKELVRCAGYLCAVTVSSGGVLNNNDLFAIKRMAVSPGDNMFVFRLKVNGYYGFIKQSVRMILDKGHDDKE